MQIQVGPFKEFVYFWALAMTFVVVLLSQFYGIKISNVPAFFVYIIFVVVFSNGIIFKKVKNKSVLKIAFLYFILATASIFIQFKVYGSFVDISGMDTYKHAMTNLFITFFYFLMGIIAVFPSGNSHKKKGVLLVFFVFCLFIFSGMGDLNYENVSSKINVKLGKIELSQTLITIVFFSLAYGRKYRTLVLVLGSLILFLAGSRTAFILGVLTMVFYASAIGSVSRRIKAVIGTVLVIIFFVAFVGEGSNPFLSRMLLVEGIEGDSSAQSRLRQIFLGFSGLREQLIIGNMNFVAFESGRIGYYIHNIFGYWQQYGAIVFLVVCILIFVIGKSAIIDFKYIKLNDSPFITFRMLMFFYSFLALLFSMSYTFKLFWLVVGLYSVGYNSNKKFLKKKIFIE